jgi:uncharacterized membrane-anchored protein
VSSLIQTVSNIVGILTALVGVVGTGFFVYGAFQYMTAGGAPHQMEKAKAAMFTALAGVVLALVAYGVVRLIISATVGSPVVPTLPTPVAP